MNINNAFPSKWIKSGDLEGGEMTLTISGLKMERVAIDSAETKPVLYFHEISKGLVLNKTNADVISQLHTPETDNWTGNKITLYLGQALYMGRPTAAVRVRLQPATQSRQQAQQTSRNGKISNVQRMQLVRWTEEQGFKPDKVKTKLLELGYASSADIEVEKFELVWESFRNPDPVDSKIPF